MSAQATFIRPGNEYRQRAVAALLGGDLIQLANGRAAVHNSLKSADANDMCMFVDVGQRTLPKTSGIVLLDGGEAYWDWSAGAVHFKKVNDRDFFIGTIVGDASSSSTTVVVNLNVQPVWVLDALAQAILSVPTGTQAVGAFGYPKRLGGAAMIELTATSEAQCIDMLTVDRVAVAAQPIVQAIIRVPTNGSGAAVDFNIGIGNGTHTTDADSITEHVFAHIDGASLAINAQSKDGTTTVAATDTTKVITAGSAVANRCEIWFDCRDSANVKIYVDGVRVLSGTTFKLNAATGPLGLLAHLEKTTGTTTAQFVIDALRARIMGE